MLSRFRSVHLWLMVDIGGGVHGGKADIRLGDVVVGTQIPKFEGVVQYDYGKTVFGGFECTGTLNKPPQLLLTTVARLQADHKLMQSQIPAILPQMLEKYPHTKAKYTNCGQQQELLFNTEYGFKDTCDD